MTGRILRFRPRAAAPLPAAAPARPSATDRERFRLIVLPHLDGAYSFDRYLTRDPALAEDIVQEAFVRALNGFAGFRGGDAKAWLYAIVRNCVFSSPRPLASAPIDVEIADETDTPEAALLRASEGKAVRAAIEALPEPFREALVLRELEELSYRDIGAVTGAPIGTVMSRLSRARSMLAEALGAGHADQEDRA